MRKILVTGTIILSIFSSTTLAAERLSLGYIYNASKSHSEIIEVTNNSINVVSPTCFDLDINGRLEINEILDESFIHEMHAKGIKVTPFLSNHWGRKRAQAALKNPDKLIKDLVEAIELYEFDGVNVDLENLSVKDKDDLTEFMRLLREALPKEKTVSIAVAANPEKKETTWIAAYDYGALAKHVDYMVVMTYDEHCYGGAEGPVAGIEFVNKSLQVVLEEVSRDKVVMGIPLYGRLWQEGKDVGGEAIVIGQVSRIIKKYKLVPRYDEKTQTPRITLTVKDGEQGPFVNGKYLEPGTYNIWYENENSIKAKLALVNEYDILGAGLWALDNEGADFWKYYKEALNEIPYESEAEIRIREKLEYATARIVDSRGVNIARIIPVAEKTLMEAEHAEFEIVNVELGAMKTENESRTNSNVVVPIVDKIKHIKVKRYIVKMNKRIRSLKDKIYTKIVVNLELCRREYNMGQAFVFE